MANEKTFEVLHNILFTELLYALVTLIERTETSSQSYNYSHGENNTVEKKNFKVISLPTGR